MVVRWERANKPLFLIPSLAERAGNRSQVDGGGLLMLLLEPRFIYTVLEVRRNWSLFSIKFKEVM